MPSYPTVLHTSETGLDDEPLTVRALRSTYVAGSTSAIILWAADDEGRLVSDEMWCVATLNLLDVPLLPNEVVLDSNDLGRRLTADLLASPWFEDTGRVARSGYCSYPIVRYDPAWLATLVDVYDDEAMEAILSPEAMG